MCCPRKTLTCLWLGSVAAGSVAAGSVAAESAVMDQLRAMASHFERLESKVAVQAELISKLQQQIVDMRGAPKMMDTDVLVSGNETLTVGRRLSTHGTSSPGATLHLHSDTGQVLIGSSAMDSTDLFKIARGTDGLSIWKGGVARLTVKNDGTVAVTGMLEANQLKGDGQQLTSVPCSCSTG